MDRTNSIHRFLPGPIWSMNHITFKMQNTQPVQGSWVVVEPHVRLMRTPHKSPFPAKKIKQKLVYIYIYVELSPWELLEGPVALLQDDPALITPHSVLSHIKESWNEVSPAAIHGSGPGFVDSTVIRKESVLVGWKAVAIRGGAFMRFDHFDPNLLGGLASLTAAARESHLQSHLWGAIFPPCHDGESSEQSGAKRSTTHPTTTRLKNCAGRFEAIAIRLERHRY